MSDEKKDPRLPPPAFPPGSRRHLHTNSGRAPSPSRSTEGVDDEAFISPDEPLPGRRPDPVVDAFISPDDPLPSRDELEEGVVTSIGDDPHLDPEELVSAGNPYVIEVTGAVERLAGALKQKGEAGLKATSRMSRFEATLRAYCVGYIAGRRAEDEEDAVEYAPYTGFDSEG